MVIERNKEQDERIATIYATKAMLKLLDQKYAPFALLVKGAVVIMLTTVFSGMVGAGIIYMISNG